MITIHHGDCLDVLRTLADNSVDSVVTDPPYGLSFMGKRWDYDVPSVDIWRECLRVLKPGGHLLAFAGTRTQHRMAVRIEDAGFEIRDMIAWVYATGFPKSLDVSKAIDKAAGAVREVVGTRKPGGSGVAGMAPPDDTGSHIWSGKLTSSQGVTDAARQWQGWGTAIKPALEPITVARKPLDGTVAEAVLRWGTGGINVDGCRVAATNKAKFPAGVVSDSEAVFGGGQGRYADRARTADSCPDGRFPANLIHDGSDEVVGLFPGEEEKNASRFFFACKGGYDEGCPSRSPVPSALASSSPQSEPAFSVLGRAVSEALPEGLRCVIRSPERSTTATPTVSRTSVDDATRLIRSIEPGFWQESRPARLTLSLNRVSVAVDKTQTDTMTITVDLPTSGGCVESATFDIMPTNLEAGERACEQSTNRLIYCAKASKADRDDGCGHLAPKTAGEMTGGREEGSAGIQSPRAGAGRRRDATRNHHPTVKPTDLMRYLCRLVTPPGGTVLDPFVGSGSTGRGAVLEGFAFIGVEREAEYVEIAKARIAAVAPEPEPEAQPQATGQLTLF